MMTYITQLEPNHNISSFPELFVDHGVRLDGSEYYNFQTLLLKIVEKQLQSAPPRPSAHYVYWLLLLSSET